MTLVISAKQDSCQEGGGKDSPALRAWIGPPEPRRPALFLRLCGGLCALQVLLTACKVPQEETGRRGPFATERLGIEIDEMGIQIRELRRTKARLHREILARKAEVQQYQKAQSEATLASRQAKASLDKSLSELHFLEESQHRASHRAQQLRAWLDQVAKDEKELARLSARKKELPQLLEKARSALADEEAELASLNLLLKKLQAERPAKPAKPKK